MPLIANLGIDRGVGKQSTMKLKVPPGRRMTKLMTCTLARNRKHFIIVVLLLLTGAAFRFYFIHAHSSFMQSDEAVVGLMAKHIITDRQFPIFMYGQERSGALITYLVAPFFYLFGVSNLVFKSVTMGLSLIFAYLVYLLAKRIGGERVGLITLALSVFCPSFFTMRLVHACAEYLLTMVFGVVALLLYDDILFTRQLNTAKGTVLREHVLYGLLGLAMGIGFWVFPLIISFLGAVWIILFLRDRKCFFRTTFLVFSLCFAVGSLPAILFNTLPELRVAGGVSGAPNWVSYTSLFAGSTEPLRSRVLQIPRTLFQVAKESLPVLVGGSLWEYETSLWQRFIVVILMSFWLFAMLYTIGARVRLWLGRKGRRRWELTRIDVVLLQFLLALMFFATSKYRDLVREPRYLTPIFVFLPVAGACFLNWLYSNKKVLGYSVLVVVLALNIASSVWFSESLDPDHGLWPKDEELIQYLIDNKIRHPIANYWIAHSITFESNEKVISVPIGCYRFNMCKDVLDKLLSTHYIFRKREKHDRYFGFFSYGLFGTQWTAHEFADLLHNMDVPTEAYRAYEFEHYVLYNVPHQYLDPAVIIYDRLPPQ
jgi:4-amino-4-deoxy-L-arabinose transferase-like glycosyltransferase